MSEEVIIKWKTIYPDLTKENSGLVGAVVNRAEGQVIRLAMIYALLARKSEIEPEHIRAALAVW